MHKLLLDNNISHRLIHRIDDIFPNSTHVMLENLDESPDIDVWNFANKNDFTIVSKDSDFNDLVIFKGVPPKVIWLKIGNCKISEVEKILRNNYKEIKNFIEDENSSILEL